MTSALVIRGASDYSSMLLGIGEGSCSRAGTWVVRHAHSHPLRILEIGAWGLLEIGLQPPLPV